MSMPLRARAAFTRAAATRAKGRTVLEVRDLCGGGWAGPGFTACDGRRPLAMGSRECSRKRRQ